MSPMTVSKINEKRRAGIQFRLKTGRPAINDVNSLNVILDMEKNPQNTFFKLGQDNDVAFNSMHEVLKSILIFRATDICIIKQNL